MSEVLFVIKDMWPSM